MSSSEDRRACPSCGGPLKGRELSCEFCGSSLAPGLGDEQLQKACTAFVEAMEKDLGELATPRVIAGFLLFFFSVPAAYFAAKFLGASTIESVVVTVFVGLGTMVAAGLNLGAEEGRHFKRVLRPQIDDFMAKHDLRRDEFLVTARGALKESSTLLKHLDDLYSGP